MQSSGLWICCMKKYPTKYSLPFPSQGHSPQLFSWSFDRKEEIRRHLQNTLPYVFSIPTTTLWDRELCPTNLGDDKRPREETWSIRHYTLRVPPQHRLVPKLWSQFHQLVLQAVVSELTSREPWDISPFRKTLPEMSLIWKLAGPPFVLLAPCLKTWLLLWSGCCFYGTDN